MSPLWAWTSPLGSNRSWIGDINNISITVGFVYVAILVDAWSCSIGIPDHSLI